LIGSIGGNGWHSRLAPLAVGLALALQPALRVALAFLLAFHPIC